MGRIGYTIAKKCIILLNTFIFTTIKTHMAIFLDVHKVPFKEENLQELVNAPVDEFGVTHINLFYNMEAGVCFCLLSAPDKDAVIKHHDKVNIECEWITEVNMATGNQSLKFTA
jgi:hypothetical protein